MKNIFGAAKQYILYALAFFFVMSVASCSDDDDKIDGEPYVKLGIRVDGEDLLLPLDYEYTTNYAAVGSISYFMFSNLPEWTIETENPKDEAWAEIWPKEGKKDGRFYLKLYHNMLFEDRTTTINVKYKGTTYKSFKVTQTAGVPALALSKGSVTSDTNEYRHFQITVTTNTSGWIATSDVTWLQIQQQTETDLHMVIDEYPADQEKDRVAIVTISSLDYPDLKGTFTVTQKKPTN